MMEDSRLTPGAWRPVVLLCTSAALTLVVVLLALGPIGELMRAAAAYPESRRAVAVELDIYPGMLASPPHRVALFVLAAAACGFALAGVLVRRRHPEALTVLAFAGAGAALLCCPVLVDLADRGDALRLPYQIWGLAEVAVVRDAGRALKRLAMALLIPAFLAGAAGILTFARRDRAGERPGEEETPGPEHGWHA